MKPVRALFHWPFAVHAEWRNLIAALKVDEGWRAKPYRDSRGKLTIGYGTLIENGITKEEGELLLELRLGVVWQELIERKPFVPTLPVEAQRALGNMAYNLGTPGLLSFRNMWKAIEKRDWGTVSSEAKDSLWYHQTGRRSKRLVGVLKRVVSRRARVAHAVQVKEQRTSLSRSGHSRHRLGRRNRKEEKMKIDMHYGAVYFLALVAGIKRDRAFDIAQASQLTDDWNDATIPFHVRTAHAVTSWRNRDVETHANTWIPFHFLPGGEGDTATERLTCRMESPLATHMLDDYFQEAALAGDQNAKLLNRPIGSA